MSVQTAQGCKFYIGPQNTSASTTAAYDALSYTEVGEIENMGDFGDTFNPVTFTALANGRTRKFKGSVNGGTMSLVCGLDESDPGQDALRAALDETSSATWEYAFKIELNDSAGTNPTTYYFRGLVMSSTREIGEVENIIRTTVNVEINSELTTKAAA